MSTSQLNSVGTEVSTGIYLTLWISLCFIDPSLLGFVAEIILISYVILYKLLYQIKSSPTSARFSEAGSGEEL